MTPATQSPAKQEPSPLPPEAQRKIAFLMQQLTGEDEELRKKAVACLLEPGARYALPLLVSRLVDVLKPNRIKRSRAAASLVDLGQVAILEMECRLLKRGCLGPKVLMIEVLKRIGLRLPPTEKAMLQKRLLIVPAYDRRLEVVAAVREAVMSLSGKW